MGRLGLQQRVLPAYRVVFIEALSHACQGGLGVFAGQPLPVEGIAAVEHLGSAKLFRAQNWNFSNPSSAWFTVWQAGLLKWLETWSPDALVVEANPRYLATRLAIRWMHRRRRPVLGWGLGAPPLKGPLAPLRLWERINFLHSLDALIAYSQRGAGQYLSLGIAAERVFVASNAVDPPPVRPYVEKPPVYQGSPVVLFVGRLQKRKRIDNLIYACAGLPENLRPRLLIVGEGPTRQALETLAQRVYPKAEFVGARYGDSLETFYDQADLFVLPGTGGLAVQQAMAHGLPVIVAQGDGTQDDLVRPGNGWQIPPDDPISLGQSLLEALSSPARLRQMGKEAFRVVAEEVNTEVMASAFIRALNSFHDWFPKQL